MGEVIITHKVKSLGVAPSSFKIFKKQKNVRLQQ